MQAEKYINLSLAFLLSIEGMNNMEFDKDLQLNPE
jgi:hypothetical protein